MNSSLLSSLLWPNEPNQPLPEFDLEGQPDPLNPILDPESPNRHKNGSGSNWITFFENHEMVGNFTKLVPETESRINGDHEF